MLIMSFAAEGVVVGLPMFVGADVISRVMCTKGWVEWWGGVDDVVAKPSVG